MSEALRALFNDLLAAAERAVTRPQMLTGESEQLEQLFAAIGAEYAKPADRRLLHEEELLLAHVLTIQARAQKFGEAAKASRMQQLVGVLLPTARDHAFAAMTAHRAVSTTEQDYVPARG